MATGRRVLPVCMCLLIQAVPASRSPIIASADPASPTTANVLLNPPTTGGPVSLYDVRLCPTAGGGRCVPATSPSINCPVPGLTPGATYRASALAVVDGKRVPASNMLLLTMPDANSPTLVSAVDTSGYTGQAVAQPPPGSNFTQVRHCCLGWLLVCGMSAQAAIQPVAGILQH